MFKKLLFVVGIAALSCSCFAQAFYKLEGEDAVRLVTLSNNGMYASGSQDGVAFMYDFATKKMTVLEGDYYVDGISDNGVFVGYETVLTTVSDKTVQTDYPSYYKKGVCVHLPLPSGYTNGSARGISTDAGMIVGLVYQNISEGRAPCIWTLQSDGSYVAQLLPTLEKDITDRIPQGVDALRCSEAGDVILGRMVDCSGFVSLPLIWTRSNNTQNWEMKELGKDIIFKEGAVIPSIPADPDPVNPFEYYTTQDTATYNKALEDYAAGLIDENPEWNKQKYITNPDSIAKYNEAATEYNANLEIFLQKFQELLDCRSDKSLDVNSMVLSGNGKYVGTFCSISDQEENPDPFMLASKDGTISAPLSFDLEAGTWNLKDYVKDAIVNGITNNGDLYFTTPYADQVRTSYVIPAGTDDVLDMAYWVKQKTNGVVDLRDDFTFSYEYDDDMTGEHVVVTDSLIVGSVRTSSNGRILMGTLITPIDSEIVTYFVNMDDPEGIENTDVSHESLAVYPNPATDFIYIRGSVDQITINDLSGRTMYESTNVSGSISVDKFNEGVYLVKVKTGDKTFTQKIFVKK